jgi:transcriptional regulator
MYNPSHFAEDRPEVLRSFLEANPFAILVTSGPEGPEASHVPTVLHPEAGLLRCHLARANGHWKTLNGARVLAIFQGAQHYVTPSWYPSKAEHGKVVPTWNYLAVHVRGRVRIFEDRDELLAHVAVLTDRNEREFAKPWSVDDAPRDYVEGLSRAIVGVEIAIESMEGKWKVSQNRTEADRAGVVDGLRGLGLNTATDMAEFVERQGFAK